MGVTSSIDVTEEQRKTIQSLLGNYLPGVTAWVYGSRAKWTSRPSSDLDLLVFADPNQSRQVSDLREALEESNLPFRVDLFVWDEVPKTFREEIKKNHVILSPKFSARTNANWPEVPFSCAVQVNPKVELIRGETYPFVDMAAVNANSRVVHAAIQREFKGGGSRFLDGDTLMARITPCLENGKIARYRATRKIVEAHGSTEFIVIRGRPNVTDNDYAFCLTKWDKVRKYAIEQMTGTSGRQRVPVDSFSHLSVPLPSLSEQRTIAHILGTLDDKIELNKRTNETLEATARAIFKDWFVDFGPTRAKAEGRAPYLPQKLWDLFPDALDDESNPVGWRTALLTELAALNPESWSNRNAPTEVEYIDLANTKWGTIEATQRFPWKEAPIRAKRILRPGDTIIGLVRPGNGSFAFVSSPKLTGSTGFTVLRPRRSRYTQLVLLSATAPENIKRLANLADGAAYPAVRPEVVGATRVVVPSNNDDVVMIKFSELVSPIINHMESNKRENHKLAQTRDLLLPKLVSGEIRVIGVENLVEAVT